MQLLKCIQKEPSYLIDCGIVFNAYTKNAISPRIFPNVH